MGLKVVSHVISLFT